MNGPAVTDEPGVHLWTCGRCGDSFNARTIPEMVKERNDHARERHPKAWLNM